MLLVDPLPGPTALGCAGVVVGACGVAAGGEMAWDEVAWSEVAWGEEACGELACWELACSADGIGAEADVWSGGKRPDSGGMQAERPSTTAGISASLMSWFRMRNVMTAPYLPDQNHAAMCITTLLIILPGSPDGQKGSYFPK